MAMPLYYCPPGIALPAYVRPFLPPHQQAQGSGPDGLGGIAYGRPTVPEDVYRLHPDGWYSCLNGVNARDVLRVNCVAGQMVGSWMVPVLLRGEASAIGYWSESGWTVPADVAELVEALRIRLDLKAADLGYSEEDARLAARILAINYHVSLWELGEWALFTPEAVRSIIMVAMGIPPGAGNAA